MLKEKDIKFIAKQFSMKPKSLLSISNVYMGFIKGDNGTLLASQVNSWNFFEEDTQTLLMKNFKKSYGGKIDINLFDPAFTESSLEDEDTLYSFVQEIDQADKNELKEKCDNICELIGEKHIYEDNVAILAMNGSIHKDGVARNIFVLTICKVKQGDANFIFKMGKDDEYDDLDNRFTLTSSMDCIVNLTSPLDCISYPILTEGTAIRNQICYRSSKSNKPNTNLISKVLGCDVKLTAQQENLFFVKILNTITNSKMAGKDLYNFYSYLRDNFTENDTEDDLVIERFDISKALENSDINQVTKAEDAFEEIFGFDNYSFKAKNVLPSTEKKSISISNDDADIKIKPDSLQNLKQIQDENGQVYLMVPLSENASTNGIELPIETLEN